MARPRLLDLFCGAGGAAMGYHRAGFEVVGVDLAPQPRFPFTFIRGDAVTFPLAGYDAIHASPPCQDHSALHAVAGSHGTGWQLPMILYRLRASGVPWVVENVDQAQFPADVWRVRLCGSSFGLPVRRHRWFASNVMLLVPPCDHVRQGTPIGVYGGGPATRTTSRRGGIQGTAQESRDAMGIHWMRRHEMAQAIPPVYTELIGAQLLAHMPSTDVAL